MPELKTRLRSDGPVPFQARWLMRKAARTAFAFFGYPFSGRVDIRITGDREIARINREQRRVDRPTDVLSFPMVEFSGGRADEEIKGLTGPVFLGDIVVSYERALAQAEEYGHSPSRELAYLTVHSMLHLLGFDHMEEDDKLVMRAVEETVMKELGLLREPGEEKEEYER